MSKTRGSGNDQKIKNDPTPCGTESAAGTDTAVLEFKAEIPILTEVCIPDTHSENSDGKYSKREEVFARSTRPQIESQSLHKC